MRAIDAPAALITTQAAAHAGVFKKTGRGYGFAELQLDADQVSLAHHHYADDVQERCH
jgi:hypothetical protein